MKKAKLLSTILLLTGVLIAPIAQSYAQLNGCYPDPAEKRRTLTCPNGSNYFRCICGPGDCTPGNQAFCDEL